MPVRKNPANTDKRAAFLEQVRRDRESRETTYREMALKMYPHVCGRCGREFAGKNLRELTVHHKDNNHHNNPPDGSNWELLCLYCHDDVHQTDLRRDQYLGDGTGSTRSHSLGFSAFEALKPLLESSGEAAGSEGVGDEANDK